MSVKDSVLKILSESKAEGGFVSGQELAEKCGVSRTSVWKAVEALRKSGAAIEAVTNNGYRLIKSNVFDKNSIQALIDGTLGVSVDFFETIDSTNAEAKRRMLGAERNSLHKTAIVASSQTAGRGRLGRSFASPQNTGVYLSVIFTRGDFSNPALFTANAAVAVCRALRSVFAVEAKIKWVNDVFVNGKKVCGILTEGIADFETGRIDFAVVGIGVNILNSAALPQDVAGGILREDGDVPLRRSELSAAIISEMVRIIEGGAQAQKSAMEEYRARSLLIGQQIEFSPVIGEEKQNFTCTVKDVTPDAKLLVQLADGTEKRLESGEVSIYSEKVCYN